MSNPAINWASSLQISGPPKAILHVIANHANRAAAECFLTIKTLAAEAGWNERTVQRGIGTLASAGYIAADRSGGKSKGIAFRCYLAVTGGLIEVTQRRPRGVTEKSEGVTETTNRGDRDDARLIDEPLVEPKDNPISPCDASAASDCDLFGKAILPQRTEPAVPTELVNGKRLAFERFWKLYPHRESGGRLIKPDKLAAEKAFALALKQASAEQIIEAVQTFPFQLDKPQFIPGPAVWLHRGNFFAESKPLPPPPRPKIEPVGF